MCQSQHCQPPSDWGNPDQLIICKNEKKTSDNFKPSFKKSSEKTKSNSLLYILSEWSQPMRHTTCWYNHSDALPHRRQAPKSMHLRLQSGHGYRLIVITNIINMINGKDCSNKTRRWKLENPSKNKSSKNKTSKKFDRTLLYCLTMLSY